MIEKYLISQCSPTLASLKTGSLFTVYSYDINSLKDDIEYWNNKLQNKLLNLTMLKYKNGKALVYLYRKNKLKKDFEKSGVESFMKSKGYKNIDIDDAISVLEQKLYLDNEFPHEIGLFLGYPLGDVIGFIKNSGQNSKCDGCWKVYCNEYEAIKTFKKFRKCKDIYKRLWNEGKSILQLTVDREA